MSPWGDILATTDHAPSIVISDLDLNRIAEVRRNIALTTQRRKDLYQLNEVQK